MNENHVEAYADALRDAAARRASKVIDFDGQSVSLSLASLRSHIETCGITRPMVVIDDGALDSAGLRSELESALAGLPFVVFTEFSPNPRCEDAAAAARRAAEFDADGVVAVGGGSCCDVAKIVALCTRSPKIIDKLSKGEQLDQAEPLPLIVMPTTSGTGSEATHFAAIYVGQRKVSVALDRLRPEAVILDERFHLAMPGLVAAVSGLDALGQAMESMWSVGATSVSMAYAAVAGPMIAEHLVPSVNDANARSRRSVMIGAHLAGKAINISKTTAAHALSYQLTQKLGLAHGHAVALTLGHIAAWNAGVSDNDCLDPRGPEDVRARVHRAASFVGREPGELAHHIEAMLEELSLASTLRRLPITDAMLESFAKRVDPVRLGNNPRKLRKSDVLDCLQSAAGYANLMRS